MIYTVTEHYDDNYPMYDNNLNFDCFICFENHTINGLKPIYLQQQSLYMKNCECNGTVHVDCLTMWFDKNKKCPICRKNMIKNTEKVYVIVHVIKYGTYIYYQIQYICTKFLKFLMYFTLLYTLIDFYLMIKYNKNRYYES